MLSTSQEYALRAALYLAERQGDGPIGNQQIATATKVPAAYLSKILQNLTRKGILVSKRGASGGFYLTGKAEQVNVLAVINAVEKIKRIHTCPLGLATHARRLCPMHARIDSAQCSIESAFRETTLRELLAEPGRPLPLVDSALQE